MHKKISHWDGLKLAHLVIFEICSYELTYLIALSRVLHKTGIFNTGITEKENSQYEY